VRPVTLGRRALVALALLALLVLAVGVLSAIDVVPRPTTLASLAQKRALGHGHALVWGYYVAQPFVSMGGAQLPPYVFAATAQTGAPGVFVSPELPDLKAGQVAAIIDTSTGDGSRFSPLVIHTLARWDAFVSTLIAGLLVAAALALALSGWVAGLLRSRG
jgi:hypothetical protein